mgnify:CR=1 FL=1
MNLRHYQIRALESIWQALQVEQSVLLEAACSAGKTLLFSKVVQRLLAVNPSFRALILTDREILVHQTREKLLRCAPELTLDIGIVCASVSNTKTLHKRVTIASRQSLIGQLLHFEPVNLIIVDEAHLMAMPNENDVEPPDQFGLIIKTLRGYNPKTRLLGVTATPYRLEDGYIYGSHNSPGCRPYFDDVHYKITTGELLRDGFLAPLTGKTIVSADLTERLNTVPLAGGDYNLGLLSDVMVQCRHVQSAVDAWMEHGSNRKKTIAFCVTIEHAEKLAAAFNADGIPAIAIHSEQDDLTGYANMEALKRGGGKIFCSVAKLTTGMDVPDIDCILLTRLTRSPALYKQMIGRGLRLAEGKADCLVLDLVGNNAEHGTDLDRLNVRWRRREGKNSDSIKFCPQCGVDVHPAVRICPDCGYEWPRGDFEDAEKPELVDVEYGTSPPVDVAIQDMYVSIHKSKKTGKRLLKIRLAPEYTFKEPCIYLCFPDDGYTGYAVEKGMDIWRTLTGNMDYPSSAEAALERADEMARPNSVVVDYNGQYPEVKKIEVGPIPF